MGIYRNGRLNLRTITQMFEPTYVRAAAKMQHYVTNDKKCTYMMLSCSDINEYVSSRS